MSYSYVDSNGHHIPISDGAVVRGYYSDLPSVANDTINVATIPVSNQVNPNTADLFWTGTNNPTTCLNIKHNGNQHALITYPKSSALVCGVFAIKTMSGQTEGLKFIALADVDEAACTQAASGCGYTVNN